jgi:penicillin amidase
MDTTRDLLSHSSSSSRLRRFLLRALCVLAGLAALVVLFYGVLLFWLRATAQRALPQLDGATQVPGLSAPVAVRRDEHGVPHVEAATQSDLFLAQGYVTAQDRLWQMDMLRRDAAGELAEVLGPSMLAQDKAQRVFGLEHEARRIYANLSADERARFDAYARGVNLYIDQHGDALPPEFRLLVYRPRPWTGVDSLAIGMVMVQMLDTHWYSKLARDHVAAKLHDATLEADLYPVGSWRDRPPTGILHDLNRPVAAPAKINDDEDEDAEQSRALPPVDLDALRSILHVPQCEGCAVGSNNWVVSGAHTASGRPLLANDMHLGLSEPSLWYMADLKAPGYHAAGVTLPGMPYIIEGHNEHVAWGITALMGDVQDLYFENLDGSGNFERPDESWAPLHVRQEIIHVRGGRDVTLRVQSTDHGPLLNPLLHEEKRPVALRWTACDPSLNAMPVYRVNTASNWTEFTAAFAAWNWPTLNIVYADDAGHIGYHAVGKIPVRGANHALPMTPTKRDPQLEWSGYVPFDAMPFSFDPPSGFLATANARVTTEDAAYPITSQWASPYRVERIYKALEGRDKLTPRDMLAVQTDLYSEVDQQMGHRIAYAIDHASKVDQRQREAADLLRNWDGRVSADAPAASVLTGTRKALWQMILEPKLGKDWSEYQWLESDFALEEIVMHAKPAWLPRNGTSWDDLLAAAVQKALRDGHAPRDLRQWSYGSWHRIELEHPIGKFLPFTGNTVSIGHPPMGGDATTVEQIGRSVAPSQRFIMDWSNVDGSTQNIVLGQSANPFSAYFRDQWPFWYGGTTFALPFNAPAVAAHARHTLQLVP